MKQDSIINQLNPKTLQSIGKARDALRNALDRIAELEGVLLLFEKLNETKRNVR